MGQTYTPRPSPLLVRNVLRRVRARLPITGTEPPSYRGADSLTTPRRPVMVDDQRVYSDEEFALILRKAAELVSHTETPATSSGGLTLAEMKAAAAQAGFDPVLV